MLQVARLPSDARELALERAVVHRLRDFFLALGKGWAFMGNQYPLEVGGERFVLDLLFYHVPTGRHFVLDFKRGKFRPEYSGKMGFYLAAIDDLLPNPTGFPSIGLILCTDRNEVVAEYALRASAAPMGVVTYLVHEALPREFQEALPALEDVCAEVTHILAGDASEMAPATNPPVPYSTAESLRTS
jgi:hypothetical protein